MTLKEQQTRIDWSLYHAGLSLGQAAKLLGWRKLDLAKAIHAGEPLMCGELLVSLARICGIDARWLATGIPSPAGAAAAGKLLHMRNTKQGRFDRLPQEEFDAIAEMIRATPEPDRGAGICRYCSCEELAACPQGCYWLDPDAGATICSACLEEGEIDGD